MSVLAARRPALRAGLARRAARLRLTAVAARLFDDALTLLHDPGRPDAIDVAVLSMPEMIEDARASLVPDGRFRVHVLDRSVMKAIARGFLPEDLTNNFYVTDDPDLAAAKRALRDFLAGVWRQVWRRRRLAALMSSNFTYWAERELHAAVEATGSAFVVLQKENLKTPGLETFYRPLYRLRRGRFEGRRVLCYNGIERDLEIGAGIVDADRIKVTGMPRLDRMHRWRESAPATGEGRPTVLFFFFHERTGLGFEIEDEDGFYRAAAGELDGIMRDRRAPDLARLTAETVIGLARDNPDMDVIVKAKRDHAKDARMAAFHAGDLPANLSVQAGGDPFDMIRRADVVVGGVSTAMLEALAAGRPIVVPAFAEATEEWYRPFDLGLGPVADVAAAPADLAALLVRRARERRPVRPQLEPAVARTLDHWTGNPDGGAGRRDAEAMWRETRPAAERPA